jgi:hypothetical protein
MKSPCRQQGNYLIMSLKQGELQMSQTLRRELRTAFEGILARYPDKFTLPEYEPLAEILADVALQVRGISKIELPDGSDPSWLIAAGSSSESVAALNEKIRFAQEATDKFEADLSFNPLPWTKNSTWNRFNKFVISEYQKDPNCFKKFKIRRDQEGKFSRLPANPKIYQDPDLLIAIWPSLKSQEPSREKSFNL